MVTMKNLSIEQRINTFSHYYKQKYGRKIFKIGLSTGLECPQRINNNPCLFCDPMSFIDQHSKKQETITKQIDYLAKKLMSQYGDIGLIAYFQDNTSTYGDLDYLAELFIEADNHALISELLISTRPDYIYQELLDVIKMLKHEVTVELGIQSKHLKSLQFLNRNHTPDDNISALNLLKKNHIRTSAHLILGIPGESKKDILQSVQFLTENGVSEIKFHHLVVYKNTGLAEIYNPDLWKSAYCSFDEYIDLISEIVQYINPEIVISRFFTSNISCKKDALNQFSGTKKIWINQLTKILNEKNIFQGLLYKKLETT